MRTHKIVGSYANAKIHMRCSRFVNWVIMCVCICLGNSSLFCSVILTTYNLHNMIYTY